MTALAKQGYMCPAVPTSRNAERTCTAFPLDRNGSCPAFTLPTPLPSDPDLAPPPARLRLLAGMVERLGVSGRTDPEAIVLGKLGVARELRRLAKELEA